MKDTGFKPKEDFKTQLPNPRFIPKVNKNYKTRITNKEDLRVTGNNKRRIGKTLTETATPSYNKNVKYVFVTKGKGGKLTTSVSMEDKKGRKKKFVTFNSNSINQLRNTKKNILKNKNPTVRVNSRESYSLVGTAVSDNVELWKVRRSEQLTKKREAKPMKNQQIWVKAEAYYMKTGTGKLRYSGIYYGWSSMGGTEEEAINHIFGQVREAHQLGSDTITIKVLSKGVSSYDR